MIFPAIDLMDGGCVRLLKGDFAQRTNYNIDPIVMAQSFEAAGANAVPTIAADQSADRGSGEQAVATR